MPDDLSARIERPSLRAVTQPFWQPAFGPPPYQMICAELLMVEFEADRAEIERITPPQFEPADHNRLVAFIGDNFQPPVTMEFHEAAILQPVKFQGRDALTIPYIWVSNDTAMIGGRDIYGMPKMLCDDERLQKVGSEITGTAHRYGNKLFELSMAAMNHCPPEEAPMKPDLVFLRHIPSPDPKRPAIQQVVWTTLSDFGCEICMNGKGWMDVGNPMNSGIDRLAPKSVTNAWYGKFSWVLGEGEILDEREVW